MDKKSSGCVLSDRNIKEEIKIGNIIIDPFKDEYLSSCSYDVTLGEYYYRSFARKNKISQASLAPKIINPRHKEDVDEYWGKCRKARTVKYKKEINKYKLLMGFEYILIYPKETILAHTQEFIGGKKYITTMMKTRSSLGRMGISVCKCAGWGDVGYINRWTMEITNYSEATIVLPVGKRIAQIIFFYTGNSIHQYNGKYQQGTNINQLKKCWTAEMMLPKTYNDK